jgi:predicted lipoprotein with Yx(FWY)xxD motif
MRFKATIGIAIAGLIVLAGTALWAANNGSGSYTGSSANSATDTGVVQVAKTDLGKVLVDVNGNTLYGFTDDMNGTSSCSGACASNWPPLTVTAGWNVGSGLDQATFHTITRSDGQVQLVAGQWPLYTYAGDSKPGDVNGQGSLGKWFAVSADGTLVKSSSPASSSPSSAPASSGYGY